MTLLYIYIYIMYIYIYIYWIYLHIHLRYISKTFTYAYIYIHISFYVKCDSFIQTSIHKKRRWDGDISCQILLDAATQFLERGGSGIIGGNSIITNRFAFTLDTVDICRYRYISHTTKSNDTHDTLWIL